MRPQQTKLETTWSFAASKNLETSHQGSGAESQSPKAPTTLTPVKPKTQMLQP